MAARESGGRLAPMVSAYADLDVWKLAVQLMAHPAFDEALVDYGIAMSEPMTMSWPVNKLFSQKLRYITCYLLIGNYVRYRRNPDTQPPPTLSALQRITPSSKRQVSGFISALKIGGYVIASPGERDRRMTHLKPGLALLREVGRSPLASLACAEQLLQPERPQWPHIQHDGDALAELIGSSTERYREHDVLFAPFTTVVHFTERDCGYPLLSAVMGTYFAEQTGVPTQRLPLTYDALAERLQVSRQHVGNMLTEADRNHWFSVAPGGRLSAVSPDLIAEYRTWSAGQMAHYYMLAQLLAQDRASD